MGKELVFENELIKFETNGRDYDFIATIQNKTDKTVSICNQFDGHDEVRILPNDWVGLLADKAGYRTFTNIRCGDFSVGIVK